MRQELASDLVRDDLTIEELVSRSEELLRVLVPRQTRYKVTDRPDVRTIRYYTAQGLLPKPVSYDGGRARYGGGHLIRLLLLKKLQADHYTLQQIRLELDGADDDRVLRRLESAVAAEPAVEDKPALADEPAVEDKPALEDEPALATAVTALVNDTVPAATATDTATATAPTLGIAMRRLPIMPEVTLDVNESILCDPARRRQLADALLTMARALTARDHNEPDGDPS